MTDGRTLEELERAFAAGKISPEAHKHLMRWTGGAAYADSHAEIARLVAAGEWAELNDAFGEVLVFGTGGRRGPMGAGPNRINARTIGESAQGLATCLLETAGSGRKLSAVIAFDTRHGSDTFAMQVACILAGNGIRAHLFEGPRSTPELSFAVRHLKADAGVVISASHNPPSDNGFKAYWSDGGQVVAPNDADIIRHVVATEELRTIPEAEARAAGLLTTAGSEVDDAYTRYTAGLCLGSDRDVTVVFTPLHGTGTTSVWPALEKAGFTRVHRVETQWAPDGSFPGVPDHSPNPENPSALDAGRVLAQEVGADLVIASDPDADRLGVVVMNGDGPTFLYGNQIGVLLLDHVIESLAARGGIPAGSIVYKTLVTTDLIDRICARHGVRVVGDLLVGFKYIAEAILGLPDPGVFLFGTEESHGYLRGPEVRDKDAAQAAVLLCERAAAAKTSGRTLVDDLEAIYRRYGYFREITRSMRFGSADGGGRGIETMRGLMESMRSEPPARLADESVLTVIDRSNGRVTDARSGRATGEIGGARGNVLVFTLSEDGSDRVTIRPSGTEPKVKVYIQVHAPNETALEEARRSCDARAEALASAIQTLARERTGTL